MAYATSNPPACVWPAIQTGSPAMWVYKHTDARATVEAAGYFTNAQALGMKVDDLVFVINTATPAATISIVTAITATSSTLSAATVA